MQSCPASPRQQPQRALKPRGDLFRGELYSRRGQFYGERNPLKPLTYLSYGLSILGSQREGRVTAPGTLNQKPHRLVAFQLLYRGRVLLFRYGERQHQPNGLAGNAQRFPTGRQDPQARARIKEGVHKMCYSLYEVLAVVHHQERLLGLQGFSERSRE